LSMIEVTPSRVCKKCGLPNRIRKGRAICISCQNQYQRDYMARKGTAFTKAKNQAYRDANHARLLQDKRRYYLQHWVERILYQARARAKRKGFPFDLTSEDIHIPEHCPVLGVRMHIGEMSQRDASPSLDRITPELGYVKGNVVVISYRANRLKSDADPEELERVAAWVRFTRS